MSNTNRTNDIDGLRQFFFNDSCVTDNHTGELELGIRRVQVQTCLQSDTNISIWIDQRHLKDVSDSQSHQLRIGRKQFEVCSESITGPCATGELKVEMRIVREIDVPKRGLTHWCRSLLSRR